MLRRRQVCVLVRHWWAGLLAAALQINRRIERKSDVRADTMRWNTSRLCVLSLLLLLCSSSLHFSSAFCPSNGNTNAIYVTSNMGGNIWSFDTQGNYVGEVLNKSSFPADVQVDKLRAMRFGPDGYLYISSARGSFSRIFAVSGNGLLNASLESDCTRRYLFTVTSQEKANPLLDHPYDMAFHPETDDLYVSNQNSMTITRYKRKDSRNDSGKGGEKRDEKNSNYPSWEPAPNVEIPMMSGEENLSADGVGRASDIPSNAGLFATSLSSTYTLSSVRGIAISPKLPRSLVDGSTGSGLFSVQDNSMAYYLLVCDVAGSMIHVFDPDTGERLFGLGVPSPIQVMFPARYYQNEGTVLSSEGTEVRRFEAPYIYVTSKDDGMAYMLRFSSHVSAPNGFGAPGEVYDETFIRTHRLYAITTPKSLHAVSGIFENTGRDTLLIADRSGRHIDSYASPFLTDYKGGFGPSPFLGFFAKQLPDQPEFIMSTRLEQQENIPFCYELNSDGSLRYVALCTAAHIWISVIIAVLIALPSLLLFFQLRHCIRERQRRSEAMQTEGASDHDRASAPLLGPQSRTYGSAG